MTSQRTFQHVGVGGLPVGDHHGDVGNPVPVPRFRFELVLEGVLDGRCGVRPPSVVVDVQNGLFQSCHLASVWVPEITRA